MNEAQLRKVLSDLPLGPIHFFGTIGSTNDEAKRLAQVGLPDLTLVVADEQTAGKGRAGRRWYTPAASALAFSLVLKDEYLPRLTALGALAVVEALGRNHGLKAEIKWPNDVLVDRRKLGGVLVETAWLGERLMAAILGIGVNVTQASMPPADLLTFPATSVEAVAGAPVDRLDLLHTILECLLEWRARLPSPDFISTWEQRLAFRGEWVDVISDDGKVFEGQVIGLTPEGALALKTSVGEEFTIFVGNLYLRPK